MWPQPTASWRSASGPASPSARRQPAPPRAWCGVDHSEVMLRQARRRNAGAIRAGRVDLRLATADRLPNFDAQFDKVLAVNSMGFWDDPVACLRALRSLLRPGGRIAIASQPRSPGATTETSRQAGEAMATC